MKQLKLMTILSVAMVMLCNCTDKIASEEVVVKEEEAVVDEKTDNRGEAIDWARRIELQPQTRAILEQNNSFAINFFKAVSKQNNKNLFISPYSMSAALGMLYNGAEGKTKEEIAKVLGMGNYTPEEVNEYYQVLTKALLAADPSSSLSLANAIWANEGVDLKKPFVDLNKNYYDADISTLDFSQSSALKTINDWSNEKTNGTIPKILENIDPANIVILANAIYFKSWWNYEFDKSKTVSKPFHNINGSTTTVPMMHQKELELLYAQMDMCGMTTLSFGNHAFAMNLILPTEGVGLDELIDEFDGALWKAMMARSDRVKVTLSMPRFKIESDLNLAKVLAAMGMPLAFSTKDADFSAMVDIKAWIDEVIQKSYISVDEKGAEAAAVTLIQMAGMAFLPNPPEVTMVLDRPFIFAITEQSTGAILFMGKVNAFKE